MTEAELQRLTVNRVLLELCDAAAGITRAAGMAGLLIALCISRMPYPFIVHAIVHPVVP